MKFLADSMLGRLAKWLRIMGYDTHYQSFYAMGDFGPLVRDERILLSRHAKTTDQYPGSLMLSSDHVKKQLHEIRTWFQLEPDRCRWFTRCLICNVPLEKTQVGDIRLNVPDYVLYEKPTQIRFCPSCGRHFWPGSHRERMIRQLENWGF
jgi:uncharacterized protein with PIN domain